MSAFGLPVRARLVIRFGSAVRVHLIDVGSLVESEVLRRVIVRSAYHNFVAASREQHETTDQG